jgi:hypothetical protein
VSSDTLAAAGAFLSGAGSVLGAIVVIRSMRKRLEEECRQRLELYKQGMDRGEKHDRVDSEADVAARHDRSTGTGER